MQRMLQLFVVCAVDSKIQKLAWRDSVQDGCFILELLVEVDDGLCRPNLSSSENILVSSRLPFVVQAKPRFIHLLHQQLCPVGPPHGLIAIFASVFPTITTWKQVHKGFTPKIRAG